MVHLPQKVVLTGIVQAYSFTLSESNNAEVKKIFRLHINFFFLHPCVTKEVEQPLDRSILYGKKLMAQKIGSTKQA